MCELTLEALGYSAAEAAVARRIHDLTSTPQTRVAALREILASADDEAPCDLPLEQEASP